MRSVLGRVFRFLLAVVGLLVIALGTAQATITPQTLYRGTVFRDGPWSNSMASACSVLAGAMTTNPGGAYNWAVDHVDAVAYDACFLTASSKADGSNGGTQPFHLESSGGGCPANSYGTSTCTCNAGFTDSGKNSCVAVANCAAAGSTVSAGFYDTGTSMSAGPSVLVCSGGCQLIFDGTFPAGSRSVGGVKHYYAQGSYHAAEGTCDPSTSTIPVAPSATTKVPADACLPNQVAGSVNGHAVCVTQDTGAKAPGASVPGSSTSTGTVTTPNSDGSSDAATTSTTTAPDGSTSTTVTTTHTNANGTAGGTTSTTSGTGATNGTGAGAANSGGGTGSNTTPDDGSNPCKANPAGSGCGGTPGDVPSLWTAKDKTVGTVLTNAKNTLMASGIGSGVSNFFTVQQGGTCPPSTWAIAYFHTTISVGTFCTDFAAQMFLVIRGVLLLVATFMAFRAAIE